MKLLLSCLFVGVHFCACYSQQTINNQLQTAAKQLENIEQEKRKILYQIEELKLQKIQQDLDSVGTPSLQPGEELVRHSAMCLVYAEKYEMARWVAHIITTDVLTGTVFRSNDFRPDPLVKTGSSTEADYFTKTLKPDSTWKYDAYGYDRGHLAPSADFRWSAKALSESYFYSNMSPQVAEFNREIWGSLEDKLRGYLYSHPSTQIFVVTGPVLEEGLPKIERGPNKVSIPKAFWKVALDLKNNKAIGFLIPNKGSTAALATFAMPIDSIEAITGLDFFANLQDDLERKLESEIDKTAWLPEEAGGNVEPINPTTLPKNHINTTQASGFSNQKYTVSVCGKVVSLRTSKAGNILLNLDKQFPNQVFTVFIKKENIANFSYNLLTELKDKTICIKGKVIDLDGTPAMFIEDEKQLELL